MLQFAFAHPAAAVSIEPSEQRKRCKSMVFLWKLRGGLLGELHGGYVRIPQQRRAALLGLMMAYTSAMWAAQRLGGWGLPILAARGVQQCAQTMDDPVWLGCGLAAW